MKPKYVQVFVANGHMEAEMIRIYLESGGLSPVIYQESAGLSYGLVMGPLAEARIMVPEADYDKALELLEELEHQKGNDTESIDEIDLDCPTDAE
jgi:hypothetical protein